MISRDLRAQKFKGVETVKDGQQTSKRIIQVGKVIWIVFLVMVVVLLIASVILIANTIRLSIFSRRREIEVMKLVGATNWFVRGPFMLEGLLCGLAGSLAAVLLLLLGKEIALPAISTSTRARDVKALSFSLTALALLLVGLGVGALGSGMTLRRFLNTGLAHVAPRLLDRLPSTHARTQTGTRPGEAPEPLGAPPPGARCGHARGSAPRRALDRDHAARGGGSSRRPSSLTSARPTRARPTTRSRS